MKNMNYPLLKENNTKYLSLSNFYNKKIDEFKIKRPEGLIDTWETTYKQEDGLQFHNLLNVNLELKKKELKKIVCKSLGIKNNKLKYHYFHFFEYYKNGQMKSHRHYEKEDFVCILYLNTCKGGETIFYLNDHSEDSRKRSMIKIKPQKGKLIVFSALIMHEGLPTKSNKRIAVGGFKLI
jgi:hypothetical protein